ncbi:hypothetical protein FOA52_010533 [Chlamydomonas sp. UWO 241]|nr:hypothetical protein FOA52_010533 [Chlamydomonas sp. UWO 241]
MPAPQVWTQIVDLRMHRDSQDPFPFPFQPESLRKLASFGGTNHEAQEPLWKWLYLPVRDAVVKAEEELTHVALEKEAAAHDQLVGGGGSSGGGGAGGSDGGGGGGAGDAQIGLDRGWPPSWPPLSSSSPRHDILTRDTSDEAIFAKQAEGIAVPSGAGVQAVITIRMTKTPLRRLRLAKATARTS